MLNDKFFLDVASRLAEESHCISLHVGAVIVKDKGSFRWGIMVHLAALLIAVICMRLASSQKSNITSGRYPMRSTLR